MHNREVLRAVIEQGFGRGDLSVADRVAASHITEHEYGAPELTDGPGLLSAMIEEAGAQMPDLRMTVEDIAVDGEHVWARSVGRGTDPRTGRAISLTVLTFAV
jgi:hypothetical protein